MAQSLFQYGEIRTTLTKAKELRPFAERMITLARKGTLQSRQRLIAALGDRAVIDREQQEKYDQMSDAQRQKVLRARSGRRHRAGVVPAAYNKKKIPFVAQSVIHKLITDIAPRYADRPGGYTRIIRLGTRRIGDNSDLAVLQLVGDEEGPATSERRKTMSRRKEMAVNRRRRLEAKRPRRKSRASGAKRTDAKKPDAEPQSAPAESEAQAPPDAGAGAGESSE